MSRRTVTLVAATLALLRYRSFGSASLPLSEGESEDFCSLDDFSYGDEPLAMRRHPSPHLPNYDSLPSTSSCGASSAVLHFFVRTSSKTLVIHACAGDTVGMVIAQISHRTVMTVSGHRLIYRGRQLDSAATLGECGVQNDASLQLTGRLRSTRHPRTWQLVNDLVSTASYLGAATDCSCPLNRSAVESLVEEFLGMARDTTPPQPHVCAIACHLQIFIMAGAPAALVKLYLSSSPANRIVAKKAIRLFLSSAKESICLFLSSDSNCMAEHVQIRYLKILLEFCRLLACTVGKKDPLYTLCRSTLGSLMGAEDPWFFSCSSTRLARELFPFVAELAWMVLDSLSSESMNISKNELQDFSNFLLGMLLAVTNWSFTDFGPIPKTLYSGSDPEYEDWMGSLHSIFLELLKRVDQCLKRVEDSLAQMGPVQSNSCWVDWSQILDVLLRARRFSMIYEDGDELLHSVLLTRKFPLNALLRQAKRSHQLRWFLGHKDLTDFESRRNLVLMMFPEVKDEDNEPHEMSIDRLQLLAESFESIAQAEAGALHGGLSIEFKYEGATGPGVLREWFCLLCRDIFNPQNVLFLPCPNDHRRFFPNPTSIADPLHLEYFSFCGRIIALALMHRVHVGILFDRVFFLQLAGESVTLEDVKDADPRLYMSCKEVLEMDAELLDSDILGLTFAREIEILGTRKAVDLCPGGKDIIVNSNNREEYVNLLIQHCFVTSISEQVAHFARGFGDILSSRHLQKLFFQSLDPEDFDRMLGGSDNIINVKEWKAHTEYNGYRAKDRQICWFWKIVKAMSAEQKRVLLFFWTSVKFLPVDGFGGLASKLCIYRTLDSHDHLPTSHTCFYRLCLPQYPSISVMRDRLQWITQEHVSCTFGI